MCVFCCVFVVWLWLLVVCYCGCGSCWWCGFWFGPPCAGPLFPGPPSAGPLPADPLHGTAQNFALFFPSSPATKFVLFFPLWGSSREILVVFVKTWTLKCARVEFSGCRVKPRGLWGRWGFTQQPENSKRAHLTAPALPNTTKIPREDPQRDTKRAKRWWETEKKARNFGPSHPPGPHPPGPHPSGPNPSGPSRIVKPLKH